MKFKEVQPVISDIVVLIDDVKYKDITCSIEVNCHCASDDEDNIRFAITTARCDEPYFLMGKSFWEESFGKRQLNRIIKICNEAIANYLKNN